MAKKDILSTSGSIARAGLMGGAGAAGNRAVRKIGGKVIDRQSRKMALQRRRKLRRTKEGRKKDQAMRAKKLTGLVFYIMLVIAIFKDLLDAVANLTVVLSVLSVAFTVLAMFLFGVYYYANDVSPTGRKVATWIITIIADSIPFLSFLPLFTIGFILTRVFENSKTARTIVSKSKLGRKG